MLSYSGKRAGEGERSVRSQKRYTQSPKEAQLWPQEQEGKVTLSEVDLKVEMSCLLFHLLSFCQVGQATSPAESEKWEATVVRREEGVK